MPTTVKYAFLDRFGTSKIQSKLNLIPILKKKPENSRPPTTVFRDQNGNSRLGIFHFI